MAKQRFASVSEDELNKMAENAVPNNAKHGTKFEMSVFNGKFTQTI